MKNYSIVSFVLTLLLFSTVAVAQENPVSFFDKKGTVHIETTKDSVPDSLASIYHRSDDVVWSRIVYRIIDMREKQNFQLYFPVRPNEDFRSLFRVMVEAITKGCPVYKRNARELKPSYTDSARLTGEELSKVFAYNEDNYNNIIQYDPASKKYSVSIDQYGNYVKNQLKFLIQEVIFFDNHASRMYTKIIGIAPLYALHPDNTDAKESIRYFQGSIICWFAFDQLRPYLAKQYVLPNGNETQRLTFDEFFQQKLYASYLLGEGNLFSRMLLDDEKFVNDPEKFAKRIRKEQARIENEILNVEQDLWEY
jgi:gliding motility associated protien GldN